jgi:secernin
VSLAPNSKDNYLIFGKNSDRPESEAQILTHIPRVSYSHGEDLKCTYISIPQVSETAAVILSQPYWIYGAEMGCSEYGVVIGNEAVATKEPLKEKGLLGMDLLRLGLERGKTAKEALKVITDLLEIYGQGGAHNEKGLNYHNSMIIADPTEAYVLEMAGEWWIVETVKGSRSISNNISIRGKGDIRRKGIIEHAIEKGYCKDDKDFDFKKIFSASPLPEIFPLNSRDGCSLNQLSLSKGKITTGLMMEFLREHDVGICMHSRGNQSTGSQVSQLKKGKNKSIHWFTGSTIPCLSVFKPYIFPADNFIFTAEKAAPYPEINSNWFWSKHSEFITQYKKNPKKDDPIRNTYYSKIRTIENEIFTNVINLEKQEESISDNKFVENMIKINHEAWKRSEGLIK